jgi:hypothetical protein
VSLAIRPRVDVPTPSQVAADPSSAESGPAGVDAGGLVDGRAAGMTFRYPGTWFLHDVTEVDLGHGSTSAVLTSEPFPIDCVDPMNDLNCLEQHPVGPGAIRVEIGSVDFSGAFFDPTPAQSMVFLYRRPILDEWAEHGDVTLGDMITHVLIHEIGHHFGLSDADIESIEGSA